MSSQFPNTAISGGGVNPTILAQLVAVERQRQKLTQQQLVLRYGNPLYPHPPPDGSLLHRIAAFDRNRQKGFVFLAVNLQRPSLSKPWGISFSKFDDHIVLGDVNPNVRNYEFFSLLVRSRDYLLDPRLIYRPVTVTGEVPERYTEKLYDYLSIRASSASMDKRNARLQPGDLIISVDGHKPTNFVSLTEFTAYLRKTCHVSLVVLRHPNATSAAMVYWDSRFTSVPHPDTPYRAAAASNRQWHKILAEAAGLPPPARVQRLVTPPTPTPGTHVPKKPEHHWPYAEHVAAPTQSAPLPASVRSSQLLLPKIDPSKPMNPLDFLSQVALASNASSKAYGMAKSFSTTSAGSTKKKAKKTSAVPVPDNWRNVWFEKDGEPIPFEDNWEFSPDEGLRVNMFLPPITHDFPSWLQRRKDGWSSQYKVYKHATDDGEDDCESDVRGVPADFWTKQGFSSFDDWRSQSLAKWKLSYSWNQRKRRRILEECEEVVHLPRTSMPDFQHWLHIRRNQWRLLRRQRQRQIQGQETEEMLSPDVVMLETPTRSDVSPGTTPEKIESNDVASCRKRRRLFSSTSTDIACIDDILEEKERQRRALDDRPPIDISFLFDSSKGAPDDVVVHCFQFLERQEHGKLLFINKATSKALKARNSVWRQLCPPHWVLPRRPRKPWHELYFYKLRMEQRDQQKRWDDLLIKCSNVLPKGDLLQKVEHFVLKGEADFGFHINYISPVVCERNSLLNLAVINRRHKIVRWLVDQQGADIESYDRGHFTPLLNAAWMGDRQLVRFLLQRGANRSKVGTGHSSQPLALPDFAGFTAEGWARKKGHNDIAELIRLGL